MTDGVYRCSNSDSDYGSYTGDFLDHKSDSFIDNTRAHSNAATMTEINTVKDGVYRCPNSDSGYESYIGDCPTSSRMSSVDARELREQEELKGHFLRLSDEKSERSDDDIKSVVSDGTDNDSLTYGRKTSQEAIAERYLGILLANNHELKPLYEEALTRMSKSRFVDNVRRLLKRYYLDLVLCTRTNLEKVTIHLLKNRWSRTRMAQHIADLLKPENEEFRVQIEEQTQGTKDRLHDLSIWIEKIPRLSCPDLTPELAIMDDKDLTSDDEDDEEDDKNTGALSNIGEMEEFLTRGSPFRTLLSNLRIFLLPASLDTLTRVIMSIPSDRIWFSEKDDLSLSNQIKAFVEDYTEENWNWWPLRARMRELQINQTRLHWRCVSIHSTSAIIANFLISYSTAIRIFGQNYH